MTEREGSAGPEAVVSDASLAAVDLLVPAFQASGLDELEVEIGELHVRLRRPRAAEPVAAPVPAAASSGRQAGAPDTVSPFGVPGPGMRFVITPLTGVWYAA